ncbi:glycosyl hydrolase family 10 protein [Macrophomina phaseolina]|uniref:Beta-xylanase n=1 Tax=Macrophomina phaseolina TaxID=35725 RepID=A0ABQ8G362_9PEZI|nr:glycosyl hydrolase family 10 protein [Macrophomina phaseolina]
MSSNRITKATGAATLIIALLATIVEGTVAFPSTGTTPLRAEAAKKDILIGSGAINPSYLDDPEFAAVLAYQFNSLSPENEMKWSFIQPTEGHYNWDTLDRLVAFAEENDMVVKGHGLISGCCNPDYLLNITDPTEFRAAMTAHFQAIMHRYNGKIDRWDVVTEALITQGGGLNANDFYNVLGPGYIGDAFRIARAAAPHAKLFINDNLVESLPGKRQELYDLVSGLVADGVPIDGVALQMHITEVAPIPGVVTDMVNSYRALGLETSIAELDVHTLNATLQTDIYGAVIDEALKAGITDISFWGFTDKHAYTWLPGAKPLMFNETYYPKGAFYATHTALTDFVTEP